MGTRICATTENSPVSAVPRISQGRLGAQALMIRPRVEMAVITVISRRCSNRSPSGASSNRPAP
ncbi:hypothetical protein D3C85_1600720 [compost metagenome]